MEHTRHPNHNNINTNISQTPNKNNVNTNIYIYQTPNQNKVNTLAMKRASLLSLRATAGRAKYASVNFSSTDTAARSTWREFAYMNCE